MSYSEVLWIKQSLMGRFYQKMDALASSLQSLQVMIESPILHVLESWFPEHLSHIMVLCYLVKALTAKTSFLGIPRFSNLYIMIKNQSQC